MPYSVEHINDYLLFEMPRVKCEVGLLLGGRSVSGEIARKGAELYYDEAFKSIIVSGGLKVSEPWAFAAYVATGKWSVLKKSVREDFLSAAREADYMRSILDAAKVPQSAFVYTDNTSRNTGENIANCKPDLNDFNSVAVVSFAPGQRRAMGVLRKHFSPDRMVITSYPVYPRTITKENWHGFPNRLFLNGIMRGERAKIDRSMKGNHLNQGFCVEINVDAERKNALRLPEL